MTPVGERGHDCGHVAGTGFHGRIVPSASAQTEDSRAMPLAARLRDRYEIRQIVTFSKTRRQSVPAGPRDPRANREP